MVGVFLLYRTLVIGDTKPNKQKTDHTQYVLLTGWCFSIRTLVIDDTKTNKQKIDHTQYVLLTG